MLSAEILPSTGLMFNNRNFIYEVTQKREGAGAGGGAWGA